jgi:hypothetical protein
MKKTHVLQAKNRFASTILLRFNEEAPGGGKPRACYTFPIPPDINGLALVGARPRGRLDQFAECSGAVPFGTAAFTLPVAAQ